jgi:hypothetical protein
MMMQKTGLNKGPCFISLVDAKHVLEALNSCSDELDQLVKTADWYVSDVLDILESAKEIVQTAINNKELQT